jgi:type IV secretion system protein VirB6
LLIFTFSRGWAKIASRGLEIILQCKQKAGNAGLGDIAEALGWYIIGAIIAVGFALVVVVGGVAILMSTIYLKIMFAVGPFFIMALMFPVTAKFFDSWAGVTLNHILIIALTTVVLTLSITIYDHQITKAFLEDGNVVIPADKNMLQISLELLLIAAALYAVVRGVVPLAAALAGGISMAVMDVRSLMDNVNSGRRGVQKSLELGLGAGKGLYNIGKRVTQNLRGNSISNGGDHKMAYNSGIRERLQRAQRN